MNNTEKICLRSPNETYVDISGDPEVIRQIIERIDGLEISLTSRSGFFYKSEKIND